MGGLGSLKVFQVADVVRKYSFTTGYLDWETNTLILMYKSKGE